MYKEIKKEKKRVAIYTRVSTEEQALTGFSLDGQLDKLRLFCQAQEYIIAGEYIDGGYSGRNIRRPQYQKMFEDIKNWDLILCLKMDRIHRNQINFTRMVYDLNRENKGFVSMQESIDTSTAMGRFVMDIIARISQLESEQIGERVHFGQRQKILDREAKFNGHRNAYGLTYNSETETWTYDKNKLEIVKQLFVLTKEGYSQRQLSKKFKLPNTTIRYILHNTIYAGYERWDRHFKKLPDLKPIITIDFFNEVNTLMWERNRSHKKQLKPILINQDKDIYSLDKRIARHLPLVKRPKQNPIL